MSWLGMLFAVLSIVQIRFSFVRAACEGSVTFYYTEKGDDRIENMRNYGLLEEKLEDLFSNQEVGDLEMSQTQKPTVGSTLLILDLLEEQIPMGKEYSPEALEYPVETPESISLKLGKGSKS